MELKEQILKLRNKNKSYSEIIDLLGCARSTISYHCRNEEKKTIKYKNKTNPLNFCELCNKRKSKKVKYCLDCTLKIKEKNTTINNLLITNSHPCYTYTRIRTQARRKMIKNNIEKTCKFCKTNEFSKVLEVCHIKSISSFCKTTYLSEVNHLNNLAYLCPSHHRMLDKGLIQLNLMN